MKLAIFSHVGHFKEEDRLLAYGPYAWEINIWGKHAREMTIIATVKESKSNSDLEIDHSNLRFKGLKTINFISFPNVILSLIKFPKIIATIILEMRRADHLHIRCPGNIGLLALLIQIFFPTKPKTVKYAGNWDPSSKQPLSYRLQKWLSKNEFLTRNSKVLVYGEWRERSKNVIPFFTASYSLAEKDNFSKDFSEPYRFVFVGSLNPGKRPLLAIDIINKVSEKFEVILEIFGEGILRDTIGEKIRNENIQNIILHGPRSPQEIKNAYQRSHFSILPSKSEGWPKAIAEAMFYGCIPIVTKISCLPWMLNDQERGILIEPKIQEACERITLHLRKPEKLDFMSHKAQNWSQKYNLERFESEIGAFL